MQAATKGSTTWTYTYNADGLRTGKTNGSTTYSYKWNENGQLSSMVCGTSSAWFYYDHEGKPLYMEYADGHNECSGTYRYILNLQGDVVGLYDLTRDCMAMTYTYDAWGRELSWSTLNSGYAGLIFNNPLTYRGYIYDSETGFYYLQSRYYDPTIGRFLNADDTAFLGASGTLLSWNLFGYCSNNSVNDCDFTGMLSIKAIVRFIKTIGLKALKIIKSVRKAFVQPGKINLKPFEIVIDVLVGVFVPSLGSALKLLTYKAVNKELVQIAFKSAGKSFINLLTKLGVNIGLNTLFAATVNNLIFKHMSRFLTVGGIICLVFDVIDGTIDYWFNYGKLSK